MNDTKPKSDLENLFQLSKTLDTVTDSIGQFGLDDIVLGATGKGGRNLAHRVALLRTSVNDIDQPLLKSFANDILGLMSTWFQSPETLCCLVQGIWAMYVDSHHLKGDELSLDKFSDFLDSLIAFIDLIITFLTDDIRKLVSFIPDFIKEIMDGVMGAILLVIQETLFILRDSVLNTILEWIDSVKIDKKNIWARCLPLAQLLNIIKKYISDYGILAKLMDKIKGYTSGLRAKWSLIKNNGNLIPNIKDLEYLYWLRDLLFKLKKATINFDLCVDYQYIPDPLYTVSNQTRNVAAVQDTINHSTGGSANDGVTADVLSLDDGGLAINESSNPNSTGKWRARISKESITQFGTNYLGLSREVMENAYTRSTSMDQGSILGLGSDNLDRCPGFSKIAEYYGFNSN